MTDLDALEAVLAKATQGTWQSNCSHIYGPDPDRLLIAQCSYALGPKSDDLSAIVALHNAAPALIAEHRALLARVAELEGEAEKRRKYTPDEIETFQRALDRGVWTVPSSTMEYTRSELIAQARAALEPKP